MKHIIILGDGMADRPIEDRNGKTPLMLANTPNIDKLAKMGCSGLFTTVPSDMPAGSEVANMGVLGYDVHKVYEGRGVLEAASMGIDLADDDLAMRLNFICLRDGRIKNHSAGHISTEEATELVQTLNESITNPNIQIYPGVSYRHLLVIKGGKKHIQCAPPHDEPETEYLSVMVKALDSDSKETADILNKLILETQEILEAHPVNKKRVENGQDAANCIWPWSPGYRPQMQTLKEMYSVEQSAVISAVDLIQGIGVYAGMKVIQVEGATGLYDTNYEGKTQAALEALKEVDLVYLHIEASDEAGHEGDIDLKIKTIEYLDERVVKTILEAEHSFEDGLSIAILPDHPTPCELRTHVHDPVPFVIYNKNEKPDDVEYYDETNATKGKFGTISGNEFINNLLKN